MVSYVWTFSHSEQDLEETLAEYIGALSSLEHARELVVVNDGVGSPIRDAIAERLKRAPFATSYYVLHRGAGEASALRAGLAQVAGDAVVLLPPYRQVDVSEIARFGREILSGPYDYLASWRHPRIDSFGARTLSHAFNAMTARLTGIELHDIGSGLRAMRRRVVEEVPLQGDLHRFLPVLAVQQGFRVGELPVRHVAEKVRGGDYRPGIFARRFLDLLSLFFLAKFTRKPLRFFGLVGTVVVAIGGAILLLMLVQRFFGTPMSDRPLLVLGVLMFVLGAQLFSIGLLGELIIFIYGRDLREYKVEAVHETKRPGS
jgi:hypothetical protein